MRAKWEDILFFIFSSNSICNLDSEEQAQNWKDNY